MANNKICITCGKAYKYCPSCGADKDKPMWMNIYCSDNCRILFNTATNYFGGDITKDEAKEIVDKADLSQIDKIRPDIVKMINEVQSNSFEKHEPAKDNTEEKEKKNKSFRNMNKED